MKQSIILDLLLFTCLLSVGCYPSTKSRLSSADKELAPVILALEEFHNVNGQYPDDLTVLLEQGVIPSIPVAPGALDTIYEVTPDMQWFRFVVTYAVQEEVFLAEVASYSYRSDVQNWTRDEVSLHALVCGWIGTEYRETGKLSVLWEGIEYLSPDANDGTVPFFTRTQFEKWFGDGQVLDEQFAEEAQCDLVTQYECVEPKSSVLLYWKNIPLKNAKERYLSVSAVALMATERREVVFRESVSQARDIGEKRHSSPRKEVH